LCRRNTRPSTEPAYTVPGGVASIAIAQISMLPRSSFHEIHVAPSSSVRRTPAFVWAAYTRPGVAGAAGDAAREAVGKRASRPGRSAVKSQVVPPSGVRQMKFGWAATSTPVAESQPSASISAGSYRYGTNPFAGVQPDSPSGPGKIAPLLVAAYNWVGFPGRRTRSAIPCVCSPPTAGDHVAPPDVERNTPVIPVVV